MIVSASGGGSAATAMPTKSDGSATDYVMLTLVRNVLVASQVLVQASAQIVTGGAGIVYPTAPNYYGMIITAEDSPVIINVRGDGFIMAKRVVGETCSIAVTPVGPPGP